MRETPELLATPGAVTAPRVIQKVAVLNFDEATDVEKYEFLVNNPDISIASHTASFDKQGTFHMVVFYAVLEDRYEDHLKNLKTGDLSIQPIPAPDPNSLKKTHTTSRDKKVIVQQMGWEVQKPESRVPDEEKQEDVDTAVNDLIDKASHYISPDK